MTSDAAESQARHFDAMFQREADPWQTRTRWYERRKRALILAALPHERYERAFEPGCGAGETTVCLAPRCASLVACDASAAAVQRARARLGPASSVVVHKARMPQDWPTDSFDLVLICELGYYLCADDLARLADACRVSLSAQGTLLACHWRRAEPDMLQDATQVHALLEQHTGMRRLSHYEDDDFLLDVWSVDPRSVARRGQSA